MFNRLCGGPKGGQRLRLVVGLNQVDKIPPEDWNDRLNLPSPEMERNIDRRCADVIAKLADRTGLGKEQVEYYSATRRFRLLPLHPSARWGPAGQWRPSHRLRRWLP